MLVGITSYIIIILARNDTHSNDIFSILVGISIKRKIFKQKGLPHITETVLQIILPYNFY